MFPFRFRSVLTTRFSNNCRYYDEVCLFYYYYVLHILYELNHICCMYWSGFMAFMVLGDICLFDRDGRFNILFAFMGYVFIRYQIEGHIGEA